MTPNYTKTLEEMTTIKPVGEAWAASRESVQEVGKYKVPCRIYGAQDEWEG